MMWRRSLSRPGLDGLPCESQLSRDWPPFQARVVKPKISTLTPQRSSVRAKMSAQVAASAHRAGIVEQERDHRVAEVGVLLALERQRMQRIDDHARQPRRIEQALFQIELPGPALL